MFENVDKYPHRKRTFF